MAVTPDLNQIAIVMSQLQHNYTQLAQNWFDIFYNPNPKDVTLTFYDELGNLETFEAIPNRAKDFNNILNGEGAPEGVVVGNVGAIYQDLTNGEVYLKKVGTSSTGWLKIINADDLGSFIKRGGVNPEGNVTGNMGSLYVDTIDGSLYIKHTGTGNTGWSYIGGTVPTKLSDLTDDTATNPVDKADTLTGLNATIPELNCLVGIASNVQEQLDTKAPIPTGAVTTITTNNLEPSRTLVSSFEGKVAVSNVSTTELNYLRGVTSTIQTQLDAKLNKNHSNDSGIYLKTAYVNGTSGYNIWSNGYCEQWGLQYHGGGDGTTYQIYFSKTFANTNYTPTGSWDGHENVGDKRFNWYISSRETNYMNMVVQTEGYSSRALNVFWKVSGYLASGQY